MSNVLEQICAKKREHIAQRKQSVPEAALQEHISQVSAPRGFFSALQAKATRGEAALIAEVKKASPSKGVIRADFNPADIASAYEKGGATCLSVLTDVPYFQGEDHYLPEARGAAPLPVLRKDFMLDPYQVFESRALGADCILLIMAALSDAQANELEQAAFSLGMDALIEVHDETELERALEHLASPLIGVNNRNLKTLKIDLSTSLRLRALIPPERLPVCESGIGTHADIVRMQASGIHCFLVGESLMAQADITLATRQLLGKAA